MKSFWNGCKRVWEWLGDAWIWIKSWFITYHRVPVSYNAIYGDADDQVFENVTKIITQKEKVLVFVNEEGSQIKFSGADGLNYKIEEM